MIDFSNMLGKPLAHCFVPADQASITFVFQDGMRRSFGVVNSGGTRITPVSVGARMPTEGMIFTRVNYPAVIRFPLSGDARKILAGLSETDAQKIEDSGTDGSALGFDAAQFVATEGSVVFYFPVGGQLSDLPE